VARLAVVRRDSHTADPARRARQWAAGQVVAGVFTLGDYSVVLSPVAFAGSTY
jgi:hypothetical protein